MADFSSRGSGDCKAYTLSKDFALRALGMDDDRLRIVLVHLPKRGVDHAVLAVATTKGVMILDSILHLVLPQEKFRSEYLPLCMLNASGRWTFRQDMELARPSSARHRRNLPAHVSCCASDMYMEEVRRMRTMLRVQQS